jgi:microcystin-dependent protein
VKKIFMTAIFTLPLFLPMAAKAGGGDSYLGELFLMTIDESRHGKWCPDGSLVADGAELSIQQNVALHSVIGDRFGGKQHKTFKLPDLRGAGPETKDGHKFTWCIVANGNYPVKPDH